MMELLKEVELPTGPHLLRYVGKKVVFQIFEASVTYVRSTSLFIELQFLRVSWGEGMTLFIYL